MDLTNTPVEGTGYSVDEAATHIEKLLDSDGTTETVDADNETDEVSNTLEDEVENDTEQPETDSEEVEQVESEGETDEVEEPTARDPNEILFEIDGQGVSREEAQKGYLRQSDYTKKMQELGAHRKKWIVQEVDYHQIRAQSAQVLNDLAAHVAQVFEMNSFGQEPDWETEWANDPYEAQMKKFKWDKDKAAWQEKQSDREHAVKAVYDAQVEIARQNEAYLKNKREHEIIESREALARTLPDVFGDPQKAKGFRHERSFRSIRVIIGAIKDEFARENNRMGLSAESISAAVESPRAAAGSIPEETQARDSNDSAFPG
ncbi:hypothetical protein J2Y48_002504 [Mycoplana sp. BE70]|uniref:hypothetical protein n=1 Tax=Mycoplana sp. BE70 TaxID=2817775 RepID=UPI002858ED16|nr:hypothetical protein [Mycoplana sp. BE70]MDR6757208.1 hypothetical protein [Mycoplana sp. BE70]